MEWKANSTGPSSESTGSPGRASLVDGVTLVDREIDHHQALEGVGVAQVHQRTVGQALVRSAEVQDARRRRQSRHELAAADVHGEQHVADGHAAAELLGVGQRLGHAVTGELAVRELLDVVGFAAGDRARGRGRR